MSDLTILLVGGYGTFGGRIVQLLEDEPRLTLIVTGRRIESAIRYCATRHEAKARLVPAVFDRDGDLPGQLSVLQPHILVDASGPFQAYRQQPYGLVEACIACGVDYLDLADGSEFVAGIGRFDSRARATGRVVLSGVSSFPVLTAAVVRKLSAGMARVETIHGGIAPSPYAGVGGNVIRAIAGYAGQRIRLKRGGHVADAYPFTEQRRFVIALPGHVPLRSTLFSLVDVPDLQVLATLWPEAQTIWMGAGPAPEIWHRCLIALAWLVRIRLIGSLAPLASLMAFATNRVRWGEDRGGMFVEVGGADAAGRQVMRSWHLLAEGADGPLIPSMAVAALVRRGLAGTGPQPGARAAVNALELEDYDALFAGRTIYTGLRDAASDKIGPLYARVLGTGWTILPSEIREMHDVDERAIAEGRASVERGRGLLARLIAFAMRFPPASADVPLRVRFDATPAEEIWTRWFGRRHFSSRQSFGRGRSERLLREHFGPLCFAMAVVAGPERLSLVLRRWSAFGVPMPMWLCPWTEAYETAEAGRFNFHVAIGHRFAGLIVRYRGWLRRVE